MTSDEETRLHVLERERDAAVDWNTLVAERIVALEAACEQALITLQSPSYPDAAAPLLRVLGREDEIQATWARIFAHMDKLRRGEA